MKIIGTLIKKTTEISYKRNQKKTVDFSAQLLTLINLLRTAEYTQFGKHYRFNQILNESDFISKYQDMVPIMDYTEFHENWLKDTIEGKPDHTWPEVISYFALSSGTTGAPSKKIPVSKDMIRSFQKTSMSQTSVLHSLNLDAEIYQKSILTIGGSIKLKEVDNHFEGDLSGILRKHTSWITTPFTKPGKDIAELKDWNEKMKLITEKAPQWDISVMAGIPSWCIMLLENIVEHYQVESIHDIWPNLRVYVHGGVFMQPYVKRLEKISAQKIHLLDTYLASEGYFAYQVDEESKGMKLLIDKGIFFEFVPFDKEHFDSHGNIINKHRALTINEVVPGKDYAIVISSNAGLWRYLIGDLVQFLDSERREIKISGRIKQYLSLVGEHLTLDNINDAILAMSEKYAANLDEFTICVDEEAIQHHWYISTDIPLLEDELIQHLDTYLRSNNDDYDYARKYGLKMPLITIVPNLFFYHFMAAKGRLGAQNKIPRVMNKVQAREWKDYINSELINQAH